MSLWLAACGSSGGTDTPEPSGKADATAPAASDGSSAAVDAAPRDLAAPDLAAPDVAPDVPPPFTNETSSYKGLVPEAETNIIPVVYLDVGGKGITQTAKTPGTLKVITQHAGTHMDLAQAPVDLTSKVVVSIRGSSSAGFPQKSYSVEFQDDTMMEAKTGVLGMPKEGNWALVACWTDKPCMRNALAYSIGRELGRWNPRGRFVELFLDGKYNGLYMLSEVPRADNKRIPVNKPAPDMSMGDLSGGYVIRREAGGKGKPADKVPRDWLSPTKAPTNGLQIVYTYHYPKEDVITPAQKQYIQGHLQKFEEMMASDAWSDPKEGYRKWIDLPSWLDFALVQEVTNNVDGYWKSMYITKLPDAEGGKLFMTPLWDFNIAFGNADYRDGWKLDNTLHNMNRFYGECTDWAKPPMGCGSCSSGGKCANAPYLPFWWDKLWTDPAFQNDLKCRWQTLRKKGGALDLDRINMKIEAWRQNLLANAVSRHFTKWSVLKRDTHDRGGKQVPGVWPNPCKLTQDLYKDEPCGTATQSNEDFFNYETKWFQGWVQKRIEWLDANLPGTCE